MKIEQIINRCKDLAFDLDFKYAKGWKLKDPNRILVGFMPVYFPRELVHAAGGLAIGILGTGDRKQIIKGDAFYQSYICHIPRGIIELVLDGNLDGIDGFVFPSICDVIRNLSGMFKVLGKGRFVKYLDYPQNFSDDIGGTFYINELKLILSEIKKLNGFEVSDENLWKSIELYNRNRKLIEDIYDLKQQFPWRISSEDLYYILRAGMVIPVEEHNDMLINVLDSISVECGEPMDNIRVIITGSFCEQPPIGLIKTIEMAGCYIVEDDLLSGMRWIQGDIENNNNNPIEALSNAYLNKSRYSASVYSLGSSKGKNLVELAKKRNADGIIFAAPSFCDPALFDIPILHKECDASGLRHISFQYSENTGQYKVIKEQVGAFSDSIKLWEEPAVI
ncbi:MAG TPA: benzoyl-CoA reductase subunit C [Ignavibacteria bacterium]|nr:benzoyl-CoA reductase subunit C [Ignavibacteria bacterium]